MTVVGGGRRKGVHHPAQRQHAGPDEGAPFDPVTEGTQPHGGDEVDDEQEQGAEMELGGERDEQGVAQQLALHERGDGQQEDRHRNALSGKECEVVEGGYAEGEEDRQGVVGGVPLDEQHR